MLVNSSLIVVQGGLTIHHSHPVLSHVALGKAAEIIPLLPRPPVVINRWQFEVFGVIVILNPFLLRLKLLWNLASMLYDGKLKLPVRVPQYLEAAKSYGRENVTKSKQNPITGFCRAKVLKVIVAHFGVEDERTSLQSALFG